jgi:hypothetical protein
MRRSAQMAARVGKSVFVKDATSTFEFLVLDTDSWAVFKRTVAGAFAVPVASAGNLVQAGGRVMLNAGGSLMRDIPIRDGETLSWVTRGAGAGTGTGAIANLVASKAKLAAAEMRLEGLSEDTERARAEVRAARDLVSLYMLSACYRANH